MGDPWIEDLKMIRVDARYTSGSGHFCSYTAESRLDEVSHNHCSLSDAQFAKLQSKLRPFQEKQYAQTKTIIGSLRRAT